MNIYWLSFRIAEVNTTKGDYSARYQALIDALESVVVGGWWVETSAFLVFRSAKSADEIAGLVKAVIATNQDIVLIGMPHVKTMRLVGAAKDAGTLQALVDFMKKV